MMKQYKDLRSVCESNTRILTSRLLSNDEIPVINALYFRFESFGELVNTTQVRNYFAICRKNPYVRFAIWTKNAWIIDDALQNCNEKKPRNLIVVLSSIYLNSKAMSPYPFVDKVFTVYTKEYAEEHGIDINCGHRNCVECGKCYNKNFVTEINEIIHK
jgi:hypothetical protein